MNIGLAREARPATLKLWPLVLSVLLSSVARAGDPPSVDGVSLPEEIREVQPVGYPPAGYSARAIDVVVYDNGSEPGTNVGGQLLGVCSWADDYDFSNGPWATVSPRLATELLVWIQSSGEACPPGQHQAFDILVDFYDPSGFSYTANPMSASAPFQSLRVPINATCGVQTGWSINLTGLPDGGVLMPGTQVVIAYRLVDPGTLRLRPQAASGGAQNNFPVFCTSDGAPRIGASSPSYAADVNGNQILEGGSTVIVGSGPGHEHRRTSPPIYLNQRGRMRGEVPTPPTPSNTHFGAIPDAGLTFTTNSVGAYTARWYSFTINGDASDAALAFLDITTENSVNMDTAIAVYRADSTVLAFDHDDGSGNWAQLTFGVGRRAANGNGRQLDGRDGQLSAGRYYLVATAGAAVFSNGWHVTNIGGASGSVRFKFATNTNGAVLAPSVPPVATDVGRLLTPGTPGILTIVPRNQIAWWRFEVCDRVAAGSYLDVNFTRSMTQADTEAYFFDSSGNQVAFSDDADADGLPPLYRFSQFSFGNPGPRPPYSPAARPFAGQDGDLAPGVYYLGVGLSDVTALSVASTAGRWHLRSNSEASLGVTPDFITNIPRCAPVCGSADFDGDGEAGTNADITAFFTCLGGDCCPACFGADFNGDGDTGTDADIEAFFRVLGGGNC